MSAVMMGCSSTAVVDGGGGSAASGSQGDAGPQAGVYVLAVSLTHTPIPELVVFEADIEARAGMMSVVYQPLSSEDRTTPVGDTGSSGDVSVSASGLYMAPLAFRIPVDAYSDPNWGPSVELDLELHAEQASCGTVTGTVLRPSSLPIVVDGSTFALQLVSSDPNAYVEPVVDCDGNRVTPPRR